MSPTASQTVDPLGAFAASAFVAHTPHPLPLVATTFNVILDAGLAIVTTTRHFRNAEEASIEATITFPVPVHATLFALKARIGDRVLDARAKRKDVAREDYEDALERGKTAVLHEEVLRGVHMLSVGHVAPGAEIEVQSSFAVALTNLNGRGTLRIPLTVGDIYGRSGLPDSDDLAHGGPLPLADLAVECRGGYAVLIGGALEDGRAKIGLDAPIDLEATGWSARDLIGRAADGRTVTLRIEPTAAGEVSLDVAILVDHSGSMREACAGDRPGRSKHKSVVGALGRVARTVEKSDMVDLWEFDDVLTFVGSTRAGKKREAALATLVRALSGPGGGTEIGTSLDRMLTRSKARDVLLITDGKSHALDVQALAQRGRRISAVLVGEDSLEANIGHLAALTGGEIFVAAGADLVAALESALRSLKIPHQAAAPMDGPPQRVAVRRGGMTISARWLPADTATGDALTLRAVAAMAASLALPAMAAESAAALAEDEGLVTHLTSLVLVDEAGDIQQTVPAMRKVPLPSPRTVMFQGAHVEHCMADYAQRFVWHKQVRLAAIRPPAAKPKPAKVAMPAREHHDGATYNGTEVRASVPFMTVHEALGGSPLDQRLSFETFIVGRSNTLAHAAAKQVATRRRGEPLMFNPLYVHAGVGLGKTHLLQAITWAGNSTDRRVLYLTAERFMYGFVSALRTQTTLAFKEAVRAIDVLMIDDLQFLQGRSTQAEFCHTLNALIDAGRQVVIASDRPPADLESLDDRVRSQLASGLVVEIGSLGEELRLEILKSRIAAACAHHPGFEVPTPVLVFIAKWVTHNGRDLEGAVNRLLAHNKLTGQPVTLEMAEREMRDLIRPAESETGQN